MKELSLHILDIVQNSISANAKLIKININEDIQRDLFSIEIIDDGKGMSEEFLKKVTDPFVTTRTTRKVGLGISLFKAAAEMCNGHFSIRSQIGQGTELIAKFQRSHIDRAPLGNMADTIVTLIMANEQVDYLYHHKFNNKEFILDTREVRVILGQVPLCDLEVVEWIKNHIRDSLKELLSS